MLAVDVRTLDTDCLFPTGQNADLLSLRFFQKAGEPFVGEMFVNIPLKENREIVISSSRIMSIWFGVLASGTLGCFRRRLS